MWCLLFAAAAAHAEPSDGPFPDLYPVAGRSPPEIVATHELTGADEQPKDARNVISNATVKNPDNLPLGPNSRVVATFTPRPGKGPVKLVIDWAGFEAGTAPKGSHDGIVVVNAYFACEGTRDWCGVKDAHRPAESQTLFFVPPTADARTEARDVVVDGKPRKMFVGHGVLANDIVPDKPVTVHVSFNSPAHIETWRLRTTLVYGDFATQRPVEPFVPKPWTRYATVAALLALAVAWWRRGTSDEAFESDDPPKVLGSLMRALGLLWAIVGIVFLDLYAMVTGVLLAFAGGFVYYGRSFALPAMWLLLAVAWVWSIRELGTDWKRVVPRVGLITLLWLWIVLGGTKSRLGTREGQRGADAAG